MPRSLVAQFADARRVSTPLVAIRTFDPAATMQALCASNGASPKLRWDTVAGLMPLNKAGGAALGQAGFTDPSLALNLPEVLHQAAKLPAETVLFVCNAHRFLQEPAAAQAVWNLRDQFKQDERTLVLLMASVQLPAELQQDILVLHEALPSAEELKAIVLAQFENAELAKPKGPVVDKAVDALRGLAAFPAEQTTAICLHKDGLDLDGLWERKRQLINATPGLTVYRGDEQFADLKAQDNLQGYLRRVIAAGKFRAVVFLDELEKLFGGVTDGASDTSGVSLAMLAKVLSHMENHRARALMLLGPPGTGKSAVAKALGNEAGVPTIMWDIGSTKGGIVGQSEAQTDQVLAVIDAVSDGAAFWIATVNKVAALPAELRRAGRFGRVFYLDLPARDELAAIWNVHQKRCGLDPKKAVLPAHEGWTGAEVRDCCESVRDLGMTYEEAASFIVPVARSAARDIELLRQQAHGVFVSASYPGAYDKDRIVSVPARRAIRT